MCAQKKQFSLECHALLLLRSLNAPIVSRESVAKWLGRKSKHVASAIATTEAKTSQETGIKSGDCKSKSTHRRRVETRGPFRCFFPLFLPFHGGPFGDPPDMQIPTAVLESQMNESDTLLAGH